MRNQKRMTAMWVKGNDFRIVAVVMFTPKFLYIRFVGTHKEYDKIKDIKNL